MINPSPVADLLSICFSITKYAVNDLFRSGDNTPQLFLTMLPDSDVAKKMNITQTKASYSVTDELKDLMRKD